MQIKNTFTPLKQNKKPSTHLLLARKSFYFSLPRFIAFLLPMSCLALWVASSASAQGMEVRALLVPEVETTLSSQIAAQITSLNVREGDRFKKDHTLVEFDCAIFKAQLQKATMDLEAATETHEANLRLKEYASASELEVALSSAKQKRAKAEVLLNETKVDMCTVKAPFTGRVVKREANPYETVKSGDPLLEILDDSKLKLHLLVPSGWLRWLKPGKSFSIKIDETAKKYTAKVTTIGARVNPVNQTIEIDASIKGNHPELLAGMSGTASFTKNK